MPRITINIQSKAHLKINNGLLEISAETRVSRVPLADIWVIILESHYVTITCACMSKLLDAGIGVVVCGDDHMPNGLLLPIGAHSRHAEIVENQLAMSQPLKKQLWKRIVEQKNTESSCGSPAVWF